MSLAAWIAAGGRCNLGKRYSAPGAGAHVMPGNLLNLSVIRRVRFARAAWIVSVSLFYNSYEGLPGTGGRAGRSALICPPSGGHKPMETILYMRAMTFSGTFVHSKYPPRRPHSPITPVEMEWKEMSGTLDCISIRTFLNDVKG